MDASKVILHKTQTAGKRARNKKFTTSYVQVQRESKSINIGERDGRMTNEESHL